MAVALKQAKKPEFKEYAKQVIKNAQAMAKRFMDKGIFVLILSNNYKALKVRYQLQNNYYKNGTFWSNKSNS